jgi:hypothetical protein
MEATLGISLCSCLYLKLAKTICLSYCLLYFLFNKIRKKRAEQALPGSRSGRRCVKGGGPNNVYTYTCKNDKIKERKNKLTH